MMEAEREKIRSRQGVIKVKNRRSRPERAGIRKKHKVIKRQTEAEGHSHNEGNRKKLTTID